MSEVFLNTSQLLNKAVNVNLYKDLIKQINKDLMLANVASEISIELPPEQLILELKNLIRGFINNDFDTFLNFLYRIDLSESRIRNLVKDDEFFYLNAVCFLILKREWKKVWFRHNYSS
jgi:hypothetical protein